MKKIAISLGVLSMVALPVTAPLPARAEPATEILQFCETLAEAYEHWNVGECVAYLWSDHNAQAAQECAYIADIGFLDYWGFKNQGECVVTFRELFD